MKLLKFYMVVCINIFVIGCNNGWEQHDNTTLTKNSLKDIVENNVRLGDPLRVLSSDKFGNNQKIFPISANSCVILSESNMLIQGPAHAEMTSSLNLSNEQVLQSINVDTLFQGVPTSKFAAVANLLSLNQDAATKFTLSVIGSSTRPVKLSSTNIKSSTITTACGDGYVSAVTAGIYFIAQVELSFSDASQKTAVLAALNGSVSNIESLTVALDKLSKSYTNTMSLNFRVMQMGGDTTKIFNLFKNKIGNSQESAPNFYMSSISISQLKDIQNLLNDYVSNDILYEQPNTYFQNLTISKLNNLWITSKDMEQTPYKNKSTKIYYDLNSLQQLDRYMAMYNNLLQTYLSYEKFHQLIWMFEGVFPNTSKSIAGINENLKSTEALFRKLQQDYNSSISELLASENHKLSTNSLNLIQFDNDQVLKQIQKINDTGYKGAFLLKGIAADKEYLIYLGDDNYFMSFLVVPTDFSKASYKPGSIYILNDLSKYIELANDPDYQGLDPILPQYDFSFWVDNTNLSSILSDGIDIKDANVQYMPNKPGFNNVLNNNLSFDENALNQILSQS